MKFEKKIVIDITPIIPGGLNGGAKKFIIDLIKGIINKRPNYQFIILIRESVKYELNTFNLKNVKVISVVKDSNNNLFNKLFLKFLYSLKKLLRKNIIPKNIYIPNFRNVSLIFCPFTISHLKIARVPVISIVYDLQYIQYPYFFDKNELMNRENVFKDAIDNATKIICISNFTLNSVLKFKNSINKCSVIPININPININYDFHYLLEELKLEKNKYLIYPSNFWPHKNHGLLINSYLIFIDKFKNKNIKLLLTGENNKLKDNFKDYVNKINKSDLIIFSEYLNHDQIIFLIKNSHALIFPSLYEGFGIPLLEAMSLNVPVLCSNLCSLPEVGGNFPIYFNPKKPMDIVNAISVSFDDDLRNKKIQEGMIQFKKYNSKDIMINKYLELFDTKL